MSNSSFLKFTEIQIISLKEKKAFKTIISDGLTVVIGGNEAGKSSLIKSLYSVFGIDIRISSKWKKINPITIVKFTVKGKKYIIVRSNKTVGLFDSNQNLLDIFENEPFRIAKYFKDIFNYQIELSDNDFNLVTPPLNYLFLPYYIDQEDGWKKNWNSIPKKGIKNGQKEIISYHSGIKTNKEFLLRVEMKILESKFNEINKEIKVIKSITNRTALELKSITINTNIEDFQEQIDELLKTTNQLNIKRQLYIEQISELQNDRIIISDQIKLSEKALLELRKDYHFALKTEDKFIECPTCGTLHENSYVQRFELVQDESNLLDSLTELYQELKSLEFKINKLRFDLHKNSNEINKIDEILLKHKNQIKLKDIIENEGKKAMQTKLKSESLLLEENLSKLTIDYSRKKDNLDNLRNPERIKSIKKDYYQFMNLFLKELNVNNSDENDYKDMNSKIVSNEIGNTVPRMLLAYYFSFFHLMKKYSSTVYFPIIIDSPNQQAPDRENLKNIIKFIFNNLPKGGQHIIGLEDTLKVDYLGQTISLEKGKGLLRKEFYDEVLTFSESLLLKINANRRTTLL